MSKALCDATAAPWRFHGIARAYVFLTAFLTGLGWILSSFQKLNWIGPLFFAGLAAAVWIARKPCGSGREFVAELVAPFKSALVIVVAILILAGAILYPPGMLDSLTYRLPRVLLWLVQGGVYYVESAEPRLNYLCHVWELCTAPILVLAGVRFSWLWSFLSWLVCQTIFYHWGLRLGQSPTRARRLALLANTSTFAVLQASDTSNDLMAATLLVLALEFLWGFELRREPTAINWSALSLALCTGVKPHFAVMGLPFLLWFFAARSRPWQAYPWRWLPAVLPVFLLCSAVTTFAINRANYGSIMGPEQDETYQKTGPAVNLAAGTALMAWQALQPSINPAALVFNESLERLVAASGIPSYSPRFSLHMVPVAITDVASFGVVTTALILLGWWLGLRRGKPGWLSLPVLALIAGGLGFAVAVSQFLPGSVGRSFLAFWMLGMPLAWLGWRELSDRFLRVSLCLAVGMAILGIVFNPARPLWPAKTVRESLGQRGGRLVGTLDSYLLFQDRAEAGRALADRVPEGEPFFVALITEDRPLVPVLTSRHGRGAVRFLRAGATPSELVALGPRYVLVCDEKKKDYAELVEFLERGETHRVVDAAGFVSKIRHGSEPWTLYAPKSVPE